MLPHWSRGEKKSNKGHCSQSLIRMSAHLKCGSTLCKLKNVQILSEQTQPYIEWRLHADTDVSLFLSRLAGDSGVKGILIFSLFFPFSSFSSKVFHQILPGFPSLHFVSHHRPIFLDLFLGGLATFPLPSVPRSLSPPLPFPRGGHALECSLLHKTTRSHYLLTTPREVKRAVLSTLVTVGMQGQQRRHSASIFHVNAQVRSITLL